MRGHISMLAVSGRRSSCCSSLLFKAEFFSLSIAARKERADLSLCDHFEHPSTFKHSCGKPRLARVCQALCFAGASGVMRPHPSPWPRCQGPLVLDPATVQGTLLFPGSLQLGVVTLHPLPLGRTGKSQSHHYRSFGTVCVSVWSP